MDRKLAGKVKLFGLWYWRCGWHDGQHVIEEETLGVMPAERWYVYGVGIDEMLVMWRSMNGRPLQKVVPDAASRPVELLRGRDDFELRRFPPPP